MIWTFAFGKCYSRGAFRFLVVFILIGTRAVLRSYIMGSELSCQNFDLVKFREIIPRNPCYGTFFSQNFESEFSKILIRRLSPNLSQNFGQILTQALGLTTSSELHLEVVAPRFEEIYKPGRE